GFDAAEDGEGAGELERHPIIVLDCRSFTVVRYLSGPAGKQREKRERFLYSYRAKIVAHAWPPPRRRNIFQAWLDRLGRPDQQQIAFSDEPHRGIGKHRVKRRDDRAEISLAHVVCVRPLTEDATGCEPPTNSREELLREERSHTRHPGVRRFRDDDIVAP